MTDGTEAGDLEARLDRLAARAAPLEEALAEFEHQSRRLGDRQERAGGLDAAAGRELGLVRESCAILERELGAIRREAAALKRRYAEIAGGA